MGKIFNFTKEYKKEIEDKSLYFEYMPKVVLFCILILYYLLLVGLCINKNIMYSSIFWKISLVLLIIYIISYLFLYIKAIVKYRQEKIEFILKDDVTRKEKKSVSQFVGEHMIFFLATSMVCSMFTFNRIAYSQFAGKINIYGSIIFIILGSLPGYIIIFLLYKNGDL